MSRRSRPRRSLRAVARHGRRRFRDKANGEEQLVLVHGALDTTKPVTVRMHSLDLFADVIGESSARSGVLQGAMRMIEQEGSGVVVALHAAAAGSLSR